MNYANRYTSIIDSPLHFTEPSTAQTKRQQPNKPTPISKEIEDSLKNYFAYLNGINTSSPNGTSRATKDSSKKYNTVNPNNYVLFEAKQNKEKNSKSPVVSAYTTGQKSTGSTNESNSNKNNKFATVNATDLKKKINDAFLLLSEAQQQQIKQQQQHDRQTLEQLKQRNRRSKVAADSDLVQLDSEIDSIVENISKAEDSRRQSVLVETNKTQAKVKQSFEDAKTTEEIEKAANFSHSSNESMIKLSDDVKKQTESKRRSVLSTPVPVHVSESSVPANDVNGENNSAAKVTVTNQADANNNGYQANPVHKIEIRLKTNELLVKNEAEAGLGVDRDNNNIVSHSIDF